MRIPKLNFMAQGLMASSLVRVTCYAGIILFILTGAAFLFFHFMGGGVPASPGNEENFFRMLRDYDLAAHDIESPDRTIQNFERLDSALARLEKSAVSADTWLSVLKRRRNLARLHPRYTQAYKQSAARAAQAFPRSAPLAAIAATAMVRDTALDREAQAELRNFLPLLAGPAFNSLRLGLHVLLGDFSSPEKAPDRFSLSDFWPLRNVPLRSQDNERISGETEAFAINFAIVKLLNSDISGAAAEIQTILNQNTYTPSPDFLRFAAEYHFDFGDILRSAQLFSQISDDAALSRQADALWLAGYIDNARTIWSILTYGKNPDGRSLYNLALTSANQNEAKANLQKLAAIDEESFDPKSSFYTGRQFGLIHYSRMLDQAPAIALLQSSKSLKPAEYPFIDLEIHKRRAETERLGRQVAETWLLLDRHHQNEDLYYWSAWFFDFQRYFNETDVLLKRAGQYGFSGRWVSFFEAVGLLREGYLDAAADILIAMPAETANWPVFANLGRIYEAGLSPSRALEYYGRAAAKVQNPKAASRIQVRIARCHAIIGNSSDARRALEYALDLDGENLNARLELERIW